MTDRQFFARILGVHYVIEGQMFPSIKSVHLACTQRGFVGSAEGGAQPTR